MDSLVKFIKQYKASLIIAIAIIMFILFGFCSAVDVAGKAKVCGLKILFEGDGLGFSRFLSALILLAPMLVVLDESTNLKLTAKMSRIPASFFFLTSSSCHPKILVKEFSYFLMPCHQHGLGVNLLVQR